MGTKAKGKKGILTTGTKKLNKASEYLAKQTASPNAALVAAEASDLTLKRDGYVKAAQKHVDARALAELAGEAELTAEKALDASMSSYVRKGTEGADGNAGILTSLGIDLASAPTIVTGPAPAPTNVQLKEGAVSGQCKSAWSRPQGAGAFIAQYRLEPTAGNPAPADWLPAEGHHTSKVEWVIDGLPPAASLRVRVRAIGDEMGDWSDEVLGKAR
jgi:hypothetical protein